MSQPKLTPAQERVMEWLKGGHRARRWYGCVVYVNGGKVGTVATMASLERAGLVEQCGTDEWEATEEGRQWKSTAHSGRSSRR